MVVQSFIRWELVQKIIKNATGMNQEPFCCCRVWKVKSEKWGDYQWSDEELFRGMTPFSGFNDNFVVLPIYHISLDSLW